MRAVLYGALAVVALVVLGMREPPRPAATMEGETSQGYAVEVELDDDGAVQALSTRFRVRCSGGETDVAKWTASRGTFGRFEQDGDHVLIAEEREEDVDGWHMEGELRAEADRAADGSLAGVAHATFRWTREGGEDGASCAAEGVRWRAAPR